MPLDKEMNWPGRQVCLLNSQLVGGSDIVDIFLGVHKVC